MPFFKTHTTESVLRHKMQTTHYSIHCSSTQWLQLIHIAPVWNSLDCLLKPLCWALRQALGSVAIGRRGGFLFSRSIDTHWGQPYLGSSINTSGLVSVDMFLIPLLYYAVTPDSFSPPWATLREDAGRIVPSSRHQQKLHLYCTCWGLWKMAQKAPQEGGRGIQH